MKVVSGIINHKERRHDRDGGEEAAAINTIPPQRQTALHENGRTLASDPIRRAHCSCRWNTGEAAEAEIGALGGGGQYRNMVYRGGGHSEETEICLHLC